MLGVTASALAPAPPERVWELLCDTSRYAEWVEGTAAVTRTDGPTAPGSTYDELNPILGPWKARTSWTVAEFEPGRRQLHTSTDLPLLRRCDVVMEIAPEGDATRVTVTLRGETAGLVGAAFGRAMEPLVARDNHKTVANLAALVRRERRARKVHAEGETKREWERSGEVGRHGTHEGYTSGSF